MEDFLFLTAGELHVDHTAEAFHHGQGVEFSPGSVIANVPEGPPVDLELLGRLRFNSQKSFGKNFLPALFSQIVSDNGHFTVESVCGQMLQYYGR